MLYTFNLATLNEKIEDLHTDTLLILVNCILLTTKRISQWKQKTSTSVHEHLTTALDNLNNSTKRLSKQLT